MQTQEILKFIGNGQITIPQPWRLMLNMQDQVLAMIQDGKVIIQTISFDADDLDWDVENISINTLSPSDKKLVENGRIDYKAGKKEKFMSLEQFIS